MNDTPKMALDVVRWLLTASGEPPSFAAVQVAVSRGLVYPAIKGWYKPCSAISAWVTDRGRDAFESSREKEQSAAPEGKPKKLLSGWRDICEALGEKYGDRDKIKSLNRRFNGPIRNAGKGTRPMVTLDALRVWWDGLEAFHQEQANQRQGRRLSAEEQYQHGRDGVVAPGIAGHVKKSRKPT
jgi:hypothetical protein